MSENHWWRDYGSFQPWKMCPTRPDPVEVLLFFLNRQRVKHGQRVDYLMKLLDLHKTMVYDILKGEGLDSILRCRQLVQALNIHPPLLGIEAKYYPIEDHAYWWRAHGFFFNADAQGYPVVSEVIAGLRIQRTKTDEGGRVKVWSQEDLGQATSLTKDTIYHMEHNKNPQILDSMSRRTTLALALGTLAGENESTIFRLFGLDPQAYGVPSAVQEAAPALLFSTKRLTDEMINSLHQEQAALFTEYYNRHGENAVVEANEWTRQLPTLLPLANTIAQRVNLLALQSRNHRFLLAVAREQHNEENVVFHGDKAIKFAELAMTLPNPKLGNNKALLVTTNELLAAALLWRAVAHYELGEYGQAQEQIDKALNLVPALQSNQIKRHILTDVGVIHAYTATSATERALILSYFNLAKQTPLQANVPDENFIRCDDGMLYLRKAMALSSPRMKGATSEKVSDILESAQRLSNPELIRRQVIIDAFHALSNFDAGNYQETTEDALSALEKSRLIRSHLNKHRIEGLYKQLLQTSFRDKPLLAHLGLKLRTWDHGWAKMPWR